MDEPANEHNRTGISNVARKSANSHEPPRGPLARKAAGRGGLAPNPGPQRVPASVNGNLPQPGRRPVGQLVTKTAARPAYPYRGGFAPARPADRARQPSPPRAVARKHAYPAISRNANAQFDFVAPLPSRIERPTKSSPIRPRWFIADETSDPPGVRRRRDQDDVGARSAPRMMTAAMAVGGPRRARGAPSKSILVRREGHNIALPARDGFFVGPDGMVRRLRSGEGEPGEENDRNANYNAENLLPAKVARKTGPIAKGARKSDTQMASKRTVNAKAARKLNFESGSGSDYAVEAPHSSSDSEAESDEDEEEDVEQLMTALDSLTLSTIRLKEYRQLPFLLRNLRNGFRHRCRLANIRVGPKAPPGSTVSVLYRYDLEDDDDSTVVSNGDSEEEAEHEYEEREGWMIQWNCPLCTLHGDFDTREMLDFHLRRDHAEVKVDWTQLTRNSNRTWRITLIIPDVDNSESEDEEDEDDNKADVIEKLAREQKLLHSGESEQVSEPEPPIASSHTSVEEQPPRLPSPNQPPTLSFVAPEPVRAISPPAVLIPKKFRAYSPTPSRTAYTGSRSRSSTAQVQRQLVPRGSLPDRYPTPPPESDPLGPSAQPPYFSDQPGSGEAFYSCRIGGPRLYDLLNTLSLEAFGVLSWIIIDREEELFEMDDVRDEDKVILALWNRWIMLNRTTFILSDYCEGVIDFVDEYWQMIHRAAGWGALRAFLLLLVANKFLEMSEVIRILKHYETHTGMDYWYKDDNDDVSTV